jgi:hypothetical protein
MTARQYFFAGRVQGVGFRYATKRLSQGFDVLGKGITDSPQGLKLQCEGHDIRYRNTWIKELDLKEANTDF